MQTLPAKFIKSARKQHRCTWCGEVISVNAPYERWASLDGAVAVTTKMHPECSEASANCYADDFLAFSNPRGCNCGFDPGCEVCAARNQKDGK